jgi:acetyltransferase-like isoleucine patch superfamily enzyme
MTIVLKLILVVLPWPLRRVLLQYFYGYEIHKTARIKLAWIYPKMLVMKEGATIDHFTVAVNLDRMELGVKTSIGRRNWITGFPSGTDSKHFRHLEDRRSELILGDQSAITKNHHIDCTSPIRIGSFVTIAGYYSQLLTHSIDVVACRQDSAPITIGDYCFIGTNVVILGGANLPPRSVLGAKSLLNKSFTDELQLYGGVPTRPIASFAKDAKYFQRAEGFVE